MSTTSKLEPVAPMQGKGPTSYPRKTKARPHWIPSNWSGKFRLPANIAERLQADLSGYRNRVACYKLALFLIRHHAASRTIARGIRTGFAIARESLGKGDSIPLTEAEIRNAIEKLLLIGLIVRVTTIDDIRRPGTNRNGAHVYRFTGEYADMLITLVKKNRKGLEVPKPARSSFFKKQPKYKTSEASLHSGYLGKVSHARRDIHVEAARYPALTGVKASQKTQVRSDDAVWDAVQDRLKQHCRGETVIFWETLGAVTPEVRQEALKAEREKPGEGFAVVWLSRFKFT